MLQDFILSYEIKYTAGGLSSIRSKSQQLWLLCSALDRGETCSNEPFAAWFFQVQQILSKTRVGSIEIKGTHECLAYYRSDQRQPERNLQQKATNRG